MLRPLVLLTFVLLGCGKVGSGQSQTDASISFPTIPDAVPATLPTAIASSSWTGQSGIASAALAAKLQGRFVTACISGYAMMLTFQDPYVRVTTFAYSDTACTAGARVASGMTWKMTVAGPDTPQPDGYDLNYDGYYSGVPTKHYEILKINATGNYVGYSDYLGTKDGTTPAERPVGYYMLTYVKL